MNEFKKCQFCHYYMNGKCLALPQVMNFREMTSVYADKFLCDSDLKIGAEEALSEKSGKIADNILYFVEKNSRMSKNNRELLRDLIERLLAHYRQAHIEEAAEFADGVVRNLNLDVAHDELENEGIEVNPEFYCKYWR